MDRELLVICDRFYSAARLKKMSFSFRFTADTFAQH